MNANPRATGREPTPRSPSRRYRDEARARLASAPPDASYRGAGRQRWRDRVSRLARLLDELQAGGGDETGLGPLLVLGFRALLPLADSGWWRARPKARLNAEVRRQLRKLDKRRRRIARGGGGDTALGRFGLRACGAAAIYARHGDAAALAACLRLLDHLDAALCGTGARRWPQRAPDRAVAVRQTHNGGGPIAATTPGASTCRARERRNV